MRWIHLAPLTAESLIVCVAMFACCEFQSAANHEKFGDVQREWGAIRTLEQIELHDGVRREKRSELTGPFDIWDGQWWRIPVTAFHHLNLMHLVLNVGSGWYLGRRLEQIWGSFRMAIFLIPSLFVPVMAELCTGHAIIGFSGVVCAMLGALSVLRHFDPALESVFPEEATQIGIVAIFACWIGTLLGIVSIANTAHVAGFLYGALVAWVCGGPWRHVLALRLGLILAHLWIIPGVLMVTRPDWVGRYHWHKAMLTRNGERAERELERAVKRDPSLTGAWLRWAGMAEERQDLPEAWWRLLEGLAANPSNAPLMDSSRRLWRHLDVRQRRAAEAAVGKVFGRQSRIWLNQIRSTVGAAASLSNADAEDQQEPQDVNRFSLDQKIELPGMDFLPDRPNNPRPFDQEGLPDAIEGETL